MNLMKVASIWPKGIKPFTFFQIDLKIIILIITETINSKIAKQYFLLCSYLYILYIYIYYSLLVTEAKS